MHIRAANQQDSHAIQELITTTFPKEENEIIAQLAADLLSETTTPATLSLVAVNGNRVVGYVAYSPLLIEGNDDFKGYILAPLGVSPDYQKRGVGSQLVEKGIQQLSEQGCQIVIVYGDPDFYGRFGFDAKLGESFIPPHPLEYPFGWQALQLNPYDICDVAQSIRCIGPLDNPKLW